MNQELQEEENRTKDLAGRQKLQQRVAEFEKLRDEVMFRAVICAIRMPRPTPKRSAFPHRPR